RIRLWDVATGKDLQRFKDSQLEPVVVRGGPNELVVARFFRFDQVRLTFARDGTTVSLATQGRLGIWKTTSGEQVFESTENVPTVLSPDGTLLAVAAGKLSNKSWHDGTLHLLDATTGKERRRLTGHRQLVMDAVFSPDGKLLASWGGDRTIRLWDTATGELL